MSDEDNTKEMNGARSDFERIMQRFDTLEDRLTVLEEKAERAAMSTKPIWEQALAEILELKEQQRLTNRKLDVLNNEILAMKAEQLDANVRIEHLEKRPS